MKHSINIFFTILLFLFLFSVLPAFASGEAEAPGGSVRNADDFVNALGGEQNVRPETLTLKRDLSLRSPIVIEEGNYVLNGAGCEIVRGFDEGAMLVVKNGASLDLGKEGAVGSDASLILTGNKKGKDACIVLTEGDVNVYGGTDFSGQSSSEAGGCFVVGDGGILNLFGGTISDCFSSADGGAIYVAENGILNISDVLVKNCSALNGGAICVKGRGALLGGTLEDCAAEKCGGGIFLESEKVTLGGICALNCNAKQGGGTYAHRKTVLNGFSAENCTAESGGGLYLEGDTVSAGFSVIGCSAADGAGIYNSGTLTLEAGYFSENTASDHGGCLFVDEKGTLVLHDGTFISGVAKLGGGIYNLGTLDMSSGGFLLCKAEYGNAVFSEGKMIFRTSVYFSKGNQAAVVIGKEDAPIHVVGKLTAPTVAQLVPIVKADDSLKSQYTIGTVLLEGTPEDLKDAAPRFLLSDANGTEYRISENGTLKKNVTVPSSVFVYAGIGMLLFSGVGACIIAADKKKKRKHREA